MGHSARLTMESHACLNSTKFDDSTKLEAKGVGSSAVAGTAELNASPTKELANKEGGSSEVDFNPAEDVVPLAAPEADSRAFKREDENEREASSDKTVVTLASSLSENGDEEFLSQSHEIVSSVVPDIVVEHVSAKDVHSRGLTSPVVVLSVSNLTPSSSFRQIRALSDSSVHVSHSSYIPPGNAEFRHLQPHIWRSLGDVDETNPPSEDSDLQEELSLRTGLKKCRISRLSAVIEPDQGDAETFEPVHAELSAPQCHLHSYRSHFSRGKSPKTYWMRRHSDSNLSTPPGSGLRPEPYPVRSRSTGDSVPGAVVPCEAAVSGVGDKESPGSSTAGEQRGTPDSSERFFPDEKVTGLYKKRLKLKKYLQTRYQTSLREMRQSSDADDVFACSPTLVTSPEPVRTHINVPSATPSPLSPMPFEIFENQSQRLILSQQRQGSGLRRTCAKELSREKLSSLSCESTEPMYHPEVRPGVAMEESLSPVSTCSSEVPVFIFPVASTSDLSVSPSFLSRHYSQGLVSPSFTATTLELEPLTSTPPSGSDVSSGVISSLLGSHDIHSYQNVVSKKPEVPSESSELPMFVDSPYDKLCQAGYLRQFSPWEASDKHTQILALARPQSHNSLLPYSPISEQSNYQIARFPSMPVLSDTSSSGVASCWQEFGEISPLLVSGQVIQLASISSDKSFETKSGYSQIQEGGVERDDSVMARSQFTCPLCSQEFVSYSHLANHMSSHLPAEGAAKDASTEAQRVHVCRVCNRSFSRSDMLTRHARLHTGLRPYECHLCGQVFSRSDHLHTHLRTHTGEKPYKCTYCPYAAPRRDMVTRHMRIHTRDVPVHRGRRSSSVSSDVPTSPVYSDIAGLRVEEVERQMMQSLSDIGSLKRSGRDYSGISVDAADVELGLAQRLVSCRTCSLTSCESTEGSDISHSFPACRAWSSTSTESFESFSSPRTREQLSWSSSTDSPDVFSRNHQQFFWSVRPGYIRPERSGAASSTAVDTLSVEMQTSFERCTVTTLEHDEKGQGAKDKRTEVKIKKEQKFDSVDDFVI